MKHLSFIFIVVLTLTSVFSWADSDLDFLLKNSDFYKNVKIEEIRSVDTFLIKNVNNEKEIIHLIGLKAPEKPKTKEKMKYDQYGFPIKEESIETASSLEEEAFNFVVEFLKGKTIRLEFDAGKKDSQDRTWAYAFVVEDNTFINAEILSQGYADLQIQAPNFKYAQELRAAYQEARKEKRGLQAQ